MKWFEQHPSEETKDSTLPETENKAYPKTSTVHNSLTGLDLQYTKQLEKLHLDRSRMIHALRSLEMEIADTEKARRAAELVSLLTEMDDGKRERHAAMDDASNDEKIYTEEISRASEKLAVGSVSVKKVAEDLSKEVDKGLADKCDSAIKMTKELAEGFAEEEVGSA